MNQKKISRIELARYLICPSLFVMLILMIAEAMLAPDNRRTATLECIEEGNVLTITYEQVEELYYQNPTFGFYFLKLATARLFDNVSRMESELARRQTAVVAAANP